MKAGMNCGKHSKVFGDL